MSGAIEYIDPVNSPIQAGDKIKTVDPCSMTYREFTATGVEFVALWKDAYTGFIVSAVDADGLEYKLIADDCTIIEKASRQ